MSYAVVFSSRTGNTALLADVVKRALPQDRLVYCGGPEGTGAEDAESVFVGFWTDKGGCDEASAAFLGGLHGKRVFLFGTAGFGGSQAYFAQILGRVRTRLDGTNTVVGSYMCQGKMPMSVRERYAAMEAQDPERARGLLANFDLALSHPDAEDLEGLRRAVAAVI